MGRKAKSLLATFVVFTALPSFGQEKPESLREAIQSALKLNEITRSTDERLESVKLATKAVKASNLPSGQIYCSTSWNQTDSQFMDIQLDSKGQSRSCGVNVGVQIYDGGAHKAEVKAAQAREEMLNNLYNTADSLTPNTRGGLAFQTLQAFLELQINRARLANAEFALTALKAFTKISKDDVLTNAIQDTEARYSLYSSMEETLVDQFEFLVKLAPSETLESLDETIKTLQIPANVEDAVDLAKEQGPSILRRNAQVDMATWNLKALKASYGPSLSAGASVSYGGSDDTYRIRSSPSTYTNKSVGLTLRIPLNPSAKYRVASSRKELEASKLEQEAAIRDAEFTLRTTYKKLETSKENYLTLAKNYIEQERVLKALVAQVEAGNSGQSDILKLISAVTTYSSRFITMSETQRGIIYQLYSVQQSTGLLFSEAGVHRSFIE